MHLSTCYLIGVPRGRACRTFCSSLPCTTPQDCVQLSVCHPECKSYRTAFALKRGSQRWGCGSGGGPATAVKSQQKASCTSTC